jgi:FMN reductase
MQSTINVLGVAGSMRADSYSTKALHIALELAKKYSAEVHLLDLGKTVLSLRDPSVPVSERVEAVARTVVEADAFILASPDYHGSMSGTLKNFLDHFYKEFGGMLFACIVASHEKGLTAMDQMRTVMRQCYAWSMPYGVSVNGEQDFVSGQLVSEEVSMRLETTARDLVVYGRLIKEQFIHDLESSEPYTFAAHYRTLLKPV